jgi:hypothetical protein
MRIRLRELEAHGVWCRRIFPDLPPIFYLCIVSLTYIANRSNFILAEGAGVFACDLGVLYDGLPTGEFKNVKFKPRLHDTNAISFSSLS